MSGSQSQADEANDDEQSSEPEFGMTWPLALTNHSGCDHRGGMKLEFSESVLPEDNDELLADLNWAIEAVNAVVHYPNLVFWVRTAEYTDLLLSYHPKDNHERAGYLRAATFSRGDLKEPGISEATETECGLLTPFDAANVLYDFIAGPGLRGFEYSLMLSDVLYLTRGFDISHPILTYDDGLLDWGRHQLKTRSWEFPDTRSRTAYSEDVYLQTEYEDPHQHAMNAVNAHIKSGR